jgi:hypothetical protein
MLPCKISHLHDTLSFETHKIPFRCLFSSLHSEEKNMDVTIYRHLVVGVVGGCQNITGFSKMSTVLSDL